MLDPENRSDSLAMMLGVGTPVAAAGETPAVGTGRRDAADDPEIWADPANRARGMILGTDKQAGLYVYDLTGRQIQFLAEGRLNNVDLRSDFPAEGRGQILIGASNRSAGGISFFPEAVNGVLHQYQPRVIEVRHLSRRPGEAHA